MYGEVKIYAASRLEWLPVLALKQAPVGQHQRCPPAVAAAVGGGGGGRLAPLIQKLYNNCTSRFRDSRRDTTARRLAERPTASADGIKAGGEHVGKAALSVERFKRYLPVSTSDSS
ncbi:unnamed protein product [Lampetra fluviatilis]